MPCDNRAYDDRNTSPVLVSEVDRDSAPDRVDAEPRSRSCQIGVLTRPPAGVSHDFHTVAAE
jgi:hypothetical protein